MDLHVLAPADHMHAFYGPHLEELVKNPPARDSRSHPALDAFDRHVGPSRNVILSSQKKFVQTAEISRADACICRGCFFWNGTPKGIAQREEKKLPME